MSKLNTRHFQRRYLHAALSLIFIVSLSACSSDDNDTGTDTGGTDVTDTELVPVDVESVAAFDSVGVASDLDASLETIDGERTNYLLEGITSEQVSPDIVLYKSLRDVDDNVYKTFATYDLESSTLKPIFETQAGQVGEFLSRDVSAVGYIESANCNTWYQSLATSAEPVLVNTMMEEFSCPRAPELTAYGDVMVYSISVGAYDANNVLRFDSSDTQRFDMGIYRAEQNEVVDLTSVGLPVDDDQLSGLQRNLGYEAGSFDGEWLVFKASFLPPSDEITNPDDYYVGTWLYNTETGESRLLNRNAYYKTISDRLPIGGEDGATISGDGNVVWYLETDGISQTNDSAPSVLKRLNLVSGQTTTVDVDGTMSALFSSDDGMRILFTLDGELVVYRHDTGTLLRTTQALKFCTDADTETGCEFESYYYVLAEPGIISGDGSAALLRPLPQRPDVTDPQNTMELMLLDVDSGLLRRVAPDHDLLWIAISYSGDTIVYDDEQDDDGNYLNEERVVVVQR